MPDAVNHPGHYNMGGPIGPDGSAEYEVIKLIEDLGWGFEFCMGNALKYTLRASHKGAEEQDLWKARWYLERAKGHRGSVRAIVFRVFSLFKAAEAWGIDKEPQLACVESIFRGDPIEALDHLDAHMEGRE